MKRCFKLFTVVDDEEEEEDDDDDAFDICFEFVLKKYSVPGLLG